MKFTIALLVGALLICAAAIVSDQIVIARLETDNQVLQYEVQKYKEACGYLLQENNFLRKFLPQQGVPQPRFRQPKPDKDA